MPTQSDTEAGPAKLRVYVPGGYVEEDVRDDFAGQLDRMVTALQWVPVADQVWEVRP